MFFFFFGGLQQQATQTLKRGVEKCISCGSPADLVEYENVLKIFFMPVLRWPGKQPLMRCDRCDILFPPPLDKKALDAAFKCRFCSQKVDPSFRFCPFCGSAL